MAVCCNDQTGVPMAIEAILGGLDQLLDLGGGIRGCVTRRWWGGGTQPAGFRCVARQDAGACSLVILPVSMANLPDFVGMLAGGRHLHLLLSLGLQECSFSSEIFVTK